MHHLPLSHQYNAPGIMIFGGPNCKASHGHGSSPDPSFRSTIVITDDGLTHTGLALREEGQVLILVDANGEELRIPLDTIEERVVSPLSPMPTVAIDVVSEKDFLHLMTYLLAQQQDVESATTGE